MSLTDDERQQLILAEAILSSEAMMWLMAGSNHVEAQLSKIRPVYNEWRILSGGYRSYNDLGWKLHDKRDDGGVCSLCNGNRTIDVTRFRSHPIPCPRCKNDQERTTSVEQKLSEVQNLLDQTHHPLRHECYDDDGARCDRCTFERALQEILND